jgi:D-serine deaminase-like pyridoxal phosphate-dependent protein
VFGDLMMKAIGIYDYADIAVTVLASVIGHNRSQNRIYIDAGALALSQDQGYDRNGLPYTPYGLIRQEDSPLPYEGIGVCQVNQEHGFVECLNPDTPFPFDAFPIGSTLRVIPNHACHSIEGFKSYHLVDENGHVIAEWERTNGW